MIVIAILGSKGGSGKTLLSHILCHGLSSHGVEAYHFTTDEGRRILSTAGRHYAILDGRDALKLERILQMLETRDCVIVLDGCANRAEHDFSLAAQADIVLIPFQASAEDLRVAKVDLERLPKALGVPMRWPRNLWQRAFTDRLLTQHLVEAMHRIIDPVPARNALATLLEDEPPESRIAAYCKEIADDVLRSAGFTLDAASEPSLRA